MTYKQMGYGMLLALALVPGIMLGGCAPHISTGYTKGTPVVSASDHISLRAIRRLGPGGRPAVDLILTIPRDETVGGTQEGVQPRLRVETEDGDPIAERRVPHGSTLEVVNLPFQQWGERICVRFLGLRGCTQPVEIPDVQPGVLAASDPMLWRASVLRPHQRENTALARFDPSCELIGATLEVYPLRRDVALAVSVMLISTDGEVRMRKAFTVAKHFRPGITPALDVQLSPHDLPDGVYRLRLHIHDPASRRSFSHEEQIELRRQKSSRSTSLI